MRIALVTASLDLKRHHGAVISQYNGYWYDTADPQQPLGQMTGSRSEVLAWADQLGADQIEIQEPTPETLATNAANA